MRIPLSLVLMAAAVEMVHSASIASGGLLNSESAVPFLVDTNSAPSARYQEVYGASIFSGHGSPQYLITQISLTSGLDSGAIDVVLPNVQIWFSTTPRAVDSLSPVFGDNLGPNNTLVYSGQLHLFWQPPIGGSTFHIPLQRPFLYDWSAGNLLMDVRNYQTVPPRPDLQGRFFASSVTLGDRVSSAAAFDVNALTATFLNTEGLLTLFTVSGVPEPSSALLFLAGLSALVLLTSCRRGRAQNRPRAAGTQ